MAKKEKKEKTVSEIAKELTLDKRNGYCKISDAEMKKVSKFCENYKKYMDESKTERECVDYAVNAAEKAGFVPFERGKDYKAGDKVYYSNRNKSLCLAVIGKNGLKNGTRIVAAHIDSPRLDLKPIPVYEASEQALLKTHYYGGIKKYQWLAIPLSMHGKVLRKDGKQVTINVGEKEGEPQFCITDILPHLGKDQAVKKLGEAVAGEDLNILAGSLPVSREKGESLFKLNVLKVLNDKYGIIEDDFISAEIEFVPAFKASDVGIDQSMIGAYGQDDRVCAYTAMEAILDCGVPDDTAVVVLADKEEIGSVGNTGLASDFLRYFISDLAAIDGLEGRHVLSDSTCLSADVAAAYDPNFASAYDDKNSCYINHGVAISKYTGSRGKGGSNDASAEFLGELRYTFENNDILWQIGELGKVDQGGGGTVAQFIAKMNVDVIDVGVPVLSMHSPWEVTSKIDIYMAYKGFKAYFVK